MDRQLLETCSAWIGAIISITCVSSAAMALVLFWLRHAVMRKQLWPLYIALAYVVFVFHYFLRGIVRALDSWPAVAGQAEWIEDWINLLGSTVNSLLFFSAAAAILGLAGRYRLLILLAALFNIWLHAVDLGPWFHFPDAILAVICLGLLGWALAKILELGPASWLSQVALFMGFGYGFVNILHALTPPFANSNLLLAGQQLDAELIQLRVNTCETFVLIAALLFRFLLFGLALVPIIGSIGLWNPTIYRDTLDSIRVGRKEFFSNNGFVRAIGKSYGADVAEIFMRIPKMSRQHLLYWHWHNHETIKDYRPTTTPGLFDSDFVNINAADFHPLLAVAKSNVLPEPTQDQSIIGKMLVTGETCSTSNLGKDQLAYDLAQVSRFGVNSLVATPILYHGAVIGGLLLKWKSSQRFSDPLIGQLEFLANLLAPGLQSERQLSTFDQCTFRLPQLELNQPGGPFSLSKRISIVQNTLSPLATLVRLDIGFRAKWSACNGRSCLRDHDLSNDEERNRSFASKKTQEVAKEAVSGNVMVRKTPLAVRDFKLGMLMLAYPKVEAHESRSSPMTPRLGANYLHRRTIATLVADAILDSARFELSAKLSEMQNSLSAPSVAKVEDWFQILNRTCHRVGFTWLVARGPAGSFYGHHGCIKLIERVMPLYGQRPKDIVLSKTRLQRPFAEAHHLVSINLPLNGARLWCGIARKEFGEELDFLSPWRDFLERFANAADSALTRLTAARELDSFALEAARQQGLNTALITTGTMTHQLVNFVDGLDSTVDTLDLNVSHSDLRDDVNTQNLLRSLKTSTERVIELVRPLRTATALDERRPCRIGEAIETARQLHQTRIEQQNIDFVASIKDSSSIEVDVPFYVLTLALANLVTNAMDATGDLGTVRILVAEDEQYVYCSVKDDGPGLAADVSADSIFKLGVTTKKGSGGWGLYLTQRSLIENKASIELVETGPAGTEIRLQLPKPTGASHETTADLRPGR